MQHSGGNLLRLMTITIQVTFSVRNFAKADSLYSRGMKPLFLSTQVTGLVSAMHSHLHTRYICMCGN